MKRLSSILILLLCCSLANGQSLPKFWTDLAEPVNTVAPSIAGETGTPEVGETLTATPGTYDNGAVSVVGTWLVNGSIAASGSTTYDTSGDEAGDVVTYREFVVNAAGQLDTISNSIVLIGSGNASIESATIDSAGTTWTVVLTGADTISDATGWSIVFSNQAERVPTYVSGSGTDTFVFTVSANPDYTAEGTDNDAAPAGTTCTLNYDADTGNVGTLADVGGFSVTNNSTAHPDPDLPGNLPVTTLPTGWDGTADYTPADFAALQELVDGDGSGDATNGTVGNETIIELDGTYTGQLVIDDSCANIIYRTADFASLPSQSTRLGDEHEEFLATITRVGSAGGDYVLGIPSGSGTTGATNQIFVGVKFEVTGSYTDIIDLIRIGELNASRDTSQLPVGIGFVHCWVTASDTTEMRDGVRFDAIDSFFVKSRFTNLDGGGEDGSTGIRCYVCARMVFDDLYMEVESAGVFLGSNETNRGDDIQISNLQITRPAEWDDANGLLKSPGVETKIALRCLIENNYIENGTWGDGTFGAISIKAGEPSFSVTDKYSRHVTIRNNDIYNCKRGIVLNEKGSSGTGEQGPNMDILVENNVVRGTTGSFSLVINPQFDDEDTFDRIATRHNSFDVVTQCGTALPGRYLIYKDNILTNFTVNATGSGGVGLETVFGSLYDFQYNAIPGGFISQYDNYGSITGVLDNNLFPADSSTLGYATYPPTALAHLEITGGVCNNAGSDGTDIGADIAELVTIMSGVVE